MARARNESEPDDILTEMVGLIPRVEVQLTGFPGSAVAGFRSDDCLSLYFGSDCFYQFDPAGRLRRAHVGGRLYRTQGSTMAELTRVRSPQATELRRRDLSAEELDDFRQQMHGLLAQLREAVRTPAAVLRQVPADEGLLPLLRERLDAISGLLAPPINAVR